MSDAKRCFVKAFSLVTLAKLPPMGFMTLEALRQMSHCFSKFNFRVPKGCHFCQHLVLFGSSLLPDMKKCKYQWQQFEYFIKQYSSLLCKLLSLTFTAWTVCGGMWWHFLPKLLWMLLMKKCSWEMLFLLWFHESRKHQMKKGIAYSLCHWIKFHHFSSTCL